MSYDSTMAKRIALVVLPLVLLQSFACVGDEPTPGAATTSSSSSGDVGQPDASSPISPGVELTVAPLVVVRGQSARASVQVARRDTTAALTLTLRGMPPGVTAAEVLVPAGASTGEFVITSETSAPYGDYAPQLVASAADLPETVRPTTLQVRGVAGALDTSYGVDGLAVQIPNAMLGDAMLDTQGRLVISGGYDSESEAVLMARLTPTGQLDPSFATGGLLRWSAPFGHLAHPEMHSAYYRSGTVERAGGYSLSAYYQQGFRTGEPRTSVVVHSEVSENGGAPSFIPASDPPDLGNYAMGSHVIRDVHHGAGDGFFVFRRGFVERYNVDHTLDASFGTAGKSDADGAAFAACVNTADRLVAVTLVQAGRPERRVVTFSSSAPNAGKLLPSGREAETATNVRLSRPNAAGHVLAGYDRILRDIAPDGAQTDLHGTRYDENLPPADATAMFPFYLPDGNLGVIAVAEQLVLHVLSPVGEQISPAAGIPLQGAELVSDTQNGDISEVFADSRGGIVVVFTTDALRQSWVIRRYFL